MKKTIYLVFAALFLVNQVFASNHPQRLIIKLNSDYYVKVNKKNFVKILGLAVKSVKSMAGSAWIVTLKDSIPREKLLKTIALISKRKDVVYCVIDRQAKFIPSPTLKEPAQPLINLSRELQWDEFLAPGGMRLESQANLNDLAWRYSHGESATPTVVAVLDTGIELNERLMGNLIKDNNNHVWGWNFSANDQNLSDETGGYHGTHVAGTIAANAYDLQGVGPLLKILPVKIPDGSGMFYESAVINGIYWALGEDVPGAPKNPYPAKVMNMSFGIDEAPGKEVESCDDAVQAAVDFARRRGTVIVVAAGNNNMEDDLGSPAGCKGVIRVASTGPEGLRAYYSNYGRGVTYAAPGGDKRYGLEGGILSTVKPGTGIDGSGLSYKQGTSMASPHVAGLFGLVLAYGEQYGIDAEKARQIIYATTHEFGQSDDAEKSCVGKKSCGHGIVDAYSALKAVGENYALMISAPLLQNKLKACEKGGVKARQNTIKNKQGTWKLIHNQCVPQNKTQLAKTKIVNGKIIADFGGIMYRLLQKYQGCKVVGVDGIACLS